MQKRIFILQFLLLHLSITIGKSEEIAATINVQYYPGSDINILFESVIHADEYQSFLEAFLGTNTNAVYLHYKRYYAGLIMYIDNIQGINNAKQNVNLYFKCYHYIAAETIECYRIFPCLTYSKVCSNGFAVYWDYGEYIRSKHLQNSSVYCSNGYMLTCYTLINQDDYSTAEFSTTDASHIEVNTDHNVSPSTTKQRYTDQVLNYSLTSIQIFTTHPTTGLINSTSLSVDQKPNSSSSVSTSVIAGVTVSIVIPIIIVILIVIVYKKRQRQKESTSNLETSTVNLEIIPNTLSGNLYNNQQDHSSDEHTDNKSTVCRLSNNERSTPNPNANIYTTNMSDKCNTFYTIARPISDSDYTGIGEGDSLALPGGLISDDTANCDYYNTVDNPDSVVSSPLTRVTKNNDYSIQGDKSAIIKILADSPQAEYATVNKNVGYKNFNEIEQNRNRAAADNYNNIKPDNTTIESNEPAKNVYSKLRENIRHFENTYGDVGVSIHAVEDNSTLTSDNAYFILEGDNTSKST